MEIVKNLITEIQKLEEELRRLTAERDRWATQLEQERVKLQEFEQELIHQLAQLQIAQCAVKEQKQQKHLAEQTLRRNQVLEAQARKQELTAKLEEERARVFYVAAQAKLALAIAHLLAVTGTNLTAISAATAMVANCRKEVMQAAAHLRESIQVHKIRKQAHVDAQNRTNDSRKTLQQVEEVLKEREEEFITQKAKVTQTKNKIDHQKTSIKETDKNLKKSNNDCKQIENHIKTKNKDLTNAKSNVEKQTSKITNCKNDILSLNQSSEHLTQQIQQIDNQLNQLHEDKQNIEQQCLTKENDIRPKRSQLADKITLLKDNEQSIRQHQLMLRENNLLLQTENTKIECIKANMDNISRTVYQLEDELYQQEQLKNTTEKQQRKLDQQKINLETELTKKKQDKQELDNNISRLSSDIQQRQQTLREKQHTMTDLEEQLNRKGKELIAKKKEFDNHQQQMDVIEAKAIKTRRQIIDITARNEKLQSDIRQKNQNKEIFEKRVLDKKNQWESRQQIFQEARKTFDEKQNVCNRFTRLKDNLLKKIDQHRQTQNKLDSDLKHSQNEFTMQRTNIQHLAIDLRQTEINIRNPIFQENIDILDENIEEDEQELEDVLNQQQLLLNRGGLTI